MCFIFFVWNKSKNRIKFNGTDLFANGALPEDDPSTLFGMKVLLPIVGYSYSNEFPFLPNTGSGQTVLTQEYVTLTQQWFNAPATITDTSYIEDIPDVVTVRFCFVIHIVCLLFV